MAPSYLDPGVRIVAATWQSGRHGPPAVPRDRQLLPSAHFSWASSFVSAPLPGLSLSSSPSIPASLTLKIDRLWTMPRYSFAFSFGGGLC
jgi:hypothetical protein